MGIRQCLGVAAMNFVSTTSPIRDEQNASRKLSTLYLQILDVQKYEYFSWMPTDGPMGTPYMIDRFRQPKNRVRDYIKTYSIPFRHSQPVCLRSVLRNVILILPSRFQKSMFFMMFPCQNSACIPCLHFPTHLTHLSLSGVFKTGIVYTTTHFSSDLNQLLRRVFLKDPIQYTVHETSLRIVLQQIVAWAVTSLLGTLCTHDGNQNHRTRDLIQHKEFSSVKLPTYPSKPRGCYMHHPL